MIDPNAINPQEVLLEIKGQNDEAIRAVRETNEILRALGRVTFESNAQLEKLNKTTEEQKSVVIELGSAWEAVKAMLGQTREAAGSLASTGLKAVLGALVGINQALSIFDTLGDKALATYDKIQDRTAAAAERMKSLSLVIHEMSKELKVSTDTYQLLSRELGADRSVVALRNFQELLKAARSGDSGAKAVFESLNVSISASRSNEKVLVQTAKALGDMNNELARSRTTAQIFGESSDKVAKRLRDIATGAVSAHDAMMVLSEKQIAISRVLADKQKAVLQQQQRIQKEIDSIKAEVFSSGGPDLFWWVDEAKLALLQRFHETIVTIGLALKANLVSAFAVLKALSLAVSINMFRMRKELLALFSAEVIGKMPQILAFFRGLAAADLFSKLTMMRGALASVLAVLSQIWTLIGPGKIFMAIAALGVAANAIMTLTDHQRALSSATAKTAEETRRLREEYERIEQRRATEVPVAKGREFSLRAADRGIPLASQFETFGATREEALAVAGFEVARQQSERARALQVLAFNKGPEAARAERLRQIDAERTQLDALSRIVEEDRTADMRAQAARDRLMPSVRQRVQSSSALSNLLGPLSGYVLDIDGQTEAELARMVPVQGTQISLNEPFLTNEGRSRYGQIPDSVAQELEQRRQQKEAGYLPRDEFKLLLRGRIEGLKSEETGLRAQTEDDRREQSRRQRIQGINTTERTERQKLQRERSLLDERFAMRELSEEELLAKLEEMALQEIELRRRTLDTLLDMEHLSYDEREQMREELAALDEELAATLDQQATARTQREVRVATELARISFQSASDIAQQQISLDEQAAEKRYAAGELSERQILDMQEGFAKRRIEVQRQALDREVELLQPGDDVGRRRLEAEMARLNLEEERTGAEIDTRRTSLGRQEYEARAQLEIEATRRRTNAVIALEEVAARDRLQRHEMQELEFLQMQEGFRARQLEADRAYFKAQLTDVARTAEERRGITEQMAALEEGDQVARARYESQFAEAARQRTEQERDTLFQVSQLYAQAFGNDREAEVMRLIQAHETMVQRLRESGMVEYIDEVSAAYKRMIEDAQSTTVDLTHMITGGLGDSIAAIFEGLDQQADIWESVRKQMVGAFAHGFAEVLKEKTGFDAKFRLNMTRDLPAMASQGAKGVAEPFAAVFNLLSGGTGVTPGVSVHGGRASIVGGSLGGSALQPFAAGTGALFTGPSGYANGLGQLTHMPSGTGALFTGPSARMAAGAAPGMLGGLAGLAGAVMPSIAGLTALQALNPKASPVARVIGGAAALGLAPTALAGMSAAMGTAATATTGAAATSLAAGSASLSSAAGSIGALGALAMPAAFAGGAYFLGNAIGLNEYQSAGMGLGSGVGAIALPAIASAAGATSGLTAGATAGSIMPGIGNIIGAILGAILGAVLGSLLNKKPSTDKLVQQALDLTFDEFSDIWTMGGQLDHKTIRATTSKLYPANRRYETVNAFGREMQVELPLRTEDLMAPRGYEDQRDLITGLGLLTLSRNFARKGTRKITTDHVNSSEFEIKRRLSPGAGERVMEEQLGEVTDNLAPSFDAALATINETMFGRNKIAGDDLLEVYAAGVSGLAEATLDLPKAAVYAIKEMARQGMIEVDVIMDYVEGILASTELARNAARAAFEEFSDPRGREQAMYDQAIGVERVRMLEKEIQRAQELNDEVEEARLKTDLLATQAANKAAEVLDPGKAFLRSITEGFQSAITEALVDSIIEAGTVQVALGPVFEKIRLAGEVFMDPASTQAEKDAAMAAISGSMAEVGPNIQQAGSWITDVVKMLDKSGIPYMSFDALGTEKIPLANLGATDVQVASLTAHGAAGAAMQIALTLNLDNAVIADEASLDLLTDRIGAKIVETVKQQGLV